jgi:hypothetical protein
VSGKIHAPTAIPPGKEPLVRIEQGVVWVLEPVWTSAEEKLFFSLPVMEPRTTSPVDWPPADGKT